ncbi:hypothetical protein TcCL_NonESM02092 [Trypanosoma cruzi]|uniref:Secreted protein n=1 Tax=Trypanosoma cruzi (strain CL Brener) TaxID=353153 RepID=Q4E0G6_TRYCC|nr:hypothetical protein, conserved [Trypanosoma cruzi]EAN98276.1 hypothetical protein, conserved [Trypanosoma cruzi]RNC47991.1 hypothetical protein TcCL_NonESM02092 [Trypanosoma cruzi]|eukprot:XP_820127.1 hypothetical protein [Trypanosoma cruzi strain CL Brener]
MFAVNLLDALAEAAVLLMFDLAPTSTCGDEDSDGDFGRARFTGVNSWSSLDSCIPRSHMNAVTSVNNSTLTPPQSPSIASGSFVQLTTEELQTSLLESPIGGLDHHCRSTEHERGSSLASTISGWTVPVRSLRPN